MTEPTHTPLPELLRELSKVIVDHLGGGSEWFTRVGDDFYVDPKAIGPELRRRKTDAQITKKALFRANTRADSHHRLLEALGRMIEIAHAYGEYISQVPSAELERHPYLPGLEDEINDARAALKEAGRG